MKKKNYYTAISNILSPVSQEFANTLRRQQLPLSSEYFSYNRNQMIVQDSEKDM